MTVVSRNRNYKGKDVIAMKFSRIKATLIVLILVLLATVFTNAAEERYTKIFANLTFSGSNATCVACSYGHEQYATLKAELWRGNTKLITWQMNGINQIYLEKIHPVIRRKTYTLKVYFIVNGNVIAQKSVTNSCP